jgi:TPR repeat protein
MVNLAILYERGEGVAASTVDADAWYHAAARRGSQPAARRGDELLQAFGPLDQSRAEAKAADIAASIRDSIGERARLTAQAPSPAATQAAADDTAAPSLKSGIGPAPGPPADSTTTAANP